MASLLLLPIPSGLLEYLNSKGLGIWILPEGDRGLEIAYLHLRLPERVLEGTDKLPHEHPHYNVKNKSIVVPQQVLDNWEHNVLIHELGHAVDYLFSDHGKVSDLRPFKTLLRTVMPLDSHCEKQDALYGGEGEQFATCFEAFFSEPIIGSSEFLHSVDDLSPELTRAFQKYMVDPFKVKHG